MSNCFLLQAVLPADQADWLFAFMTCSLWLRNLHGNEPEVAKRGVFCIQPAKPLLGTE